MLWGGDGSGAFPSKGSCGSCSAQGDTCVCDATAETARKYDGSIFPSSRDELLSNLHIGSISPTDIHYVCSANLCNAADFIVHTKGVQITDNGSMLFDEDTIFEITDYYGPGESLFLSNTESIVNIEGGYYFRNPPMFNSPVDQTQRDAIYEVEAMISHYFQHSNTAPFIAKKLIKHLVTSNPSPRYVEVVANAFTSGKFINTDDLESFGSGTYGDLAATVAAIFLDKEARSPALDEDPTYGLAREPIVKTMHFIRALELETTGGLDRELHLLYLSGKIGQEVWNAPNVFGFFSQEYQPNGVVFEKGLVAPATQLFDSPNLVGFVNAITSLSVFGLTDCAGGLTDSYSRYILPDKADQGYMTCGQASDFEIDSPKVPYRLRWLPSNRESATEVVSELDLILTGGR